MNEGLKQAKELINRGSLEAAILTLNLAIEEDWKDAELYIVRGLVHLELKNDACARLDFLCARRLQPERMAPHLGLASIALGERDFKAVNRHLKQAILTGEIENHRSKG